MIKFRLKKMQLATFAGAKICLTAALFVQPTQVNAWEATEITQIMNNVQLIGILQNGISQLSTLSNMLDNEVVQTIKQISMVQNQLQDLMSYGSSVSGQWTQAAGALSQLRNLVSRGQSLSYTLQNLDSVFSQKYPGFGNYGSGGRYADQYKNWSQVSMDGIKGALEAQGLQADDFTNEQATMDGLNDLSSSADGSVKAVQAGNAIAAQQVAQLQKLRQLQMEQFNAYASYMAGQQANQDTEKEALNRFMNQGNGTIRKPGTSGFRTYSTNSIFN